MNLKENGEKNMWRFGERKGKTEMLKIKMQPQKKKSSSVNIFFSSSCFDRRYIDFSHIQGKTLAYKF